MKTDQSGKVYLCGTVCVFSFNQNPSSHLIEVTWINMIMDILITPKAIPRTAGFT